MKNKIEQLNEIINRIENKHNKVKNIISMLDILLDANADNEIIKLAISNFSEYNIGFEIIMLKTIADKLNKSNKTRKSKNENTKTNNA